jgi:hypothetical protein
MSPRIGEEKVNPCIISKKWKSMASEERIMALIS